MSATSLNENKKLNNWYNQDFIQQYSLEDHKNYDFLSNLTKEGHCRTKSLTSRFEFESFAEVANHQSTNQTSIEISIEDTFLSGSDVKLPNSMKNKNLDENDPNFFDEKTTKKYEKSKPSNKKNLFIGNKSKPNDQVNLKKKNEPQIENFTIKKPSSVKKAIINQFLTRDLKNLASSLPTVQRKPSDGKSEETKNEKLKLFTPVLTLKGHKSSEKEIFIDTKDTLPAKIEEIKPNNSKTISKTVTKNGKVEEEKVKSEKVNPDSKTHVLPIQKHVKNNKKIKVLPAKAVFDHKNPEGFISPILSSGKFVKNPQNPEISSEFVTPDSLKNFQNSPELNYSESNSLNSADSLFKEKHEEKSISPVIDEKIKISAREPSFGLGGIDFLCEEKNEISASVENSQITQTEGRNNRMEELFKLISDKEFINSLKVIGKFAQFLEKNFEE